MLGEPSQRTTSAVTWVEFTLVIYKQKMTSKMKKSKKDTFGERMHYQYCWGIWFLWVASVNSWGTGRRRIRVPDQSGWSDFHFHLWSVVSYWNLRLGSSIIGQFLAKEKGKWTAGPNTWQSIMAIISTSNNERFKTIKTETESIGHLIYGTILLTFW